MANETKPTSSDKVREIRKPSKPGRVDLIPKEFNNLIQDQGIKVRVTPAALCPNRAKLEGTNHVLDCPICHGDEVLDLADKAFETWAYMQAIPLERKFDVNGLFDMKDAQLSVPSGVRLYYMYKVEILDFSAPYNEVIQRGKRGGADADILRYMPTEDSNVPLYLKDQDGKIYERGKDYLIDDTTKLLKWKGTNRPALNKLYTFLYPTRPTFRVIEMMHEARFYYVQFKKKHKVPVNLPQQALIRWDYLSFGSGTRIQRTTE